ncbi:MAG: nitroreductase family protein [Acidobacteriota bacterium]
MSIQAVILNRRTEKVLCDVESYRPVPPEVAERNRKTVLEAVKAAGWAPYHHTRGVAGIPEPWRVHILWHDDVRKAAVYLRDELQNTTKVPKLAAAASVVILVTWLPQFYELAARSDGQVAIDEEHLAAASAMVQNLLLLLTEQGMGTYWGSGGVFRKPEMFDYLGIPRGERLLAALHVEYREMMDPGKERRPGKNRHKRTDAWIREISL